jgi:protein-disulfide isomerase-like protein with CxxC motif
MPELNKLVSDYKDSSNIVFLAVALDARGDLKDFLKKTKFDYDIIDSGRFITQQYGISSYPTHLILDKEGKVYYHSSGYSLVTVHWLRKTIEEVVKKE